MIQKHIGDLLAIPSGIIVHGCNAQGVMNSGVARAIREQYPQAFADYRRVHQELGLKVGMVIFTTVERTPEGVPTKIIANAITQHDYGRDPHRVYVDYAGLGRCFEVIRATADKTGLDVHFPLIGCGLANGQWPLVAPQIEKALGPVEKHLWVLPGVAA